MKPLARTIASLLPLALLLPAATAQSAFTITGTVINATTGSPVPQCRITAGRTNAGNNRASMSNGGFNRGDNAPPPRGGPNNQPNSTFTDDRGRFSLGVSSAGAWSLRASATGYISQAFDEHEQYSTAVVLTDQTRTYNLVYRLTPEAAITGIILDEAGEPVRQARVAAYSLPSLMADPAAGIPNPRSFQANTDDRGHYEIAGLAPGNYRLSVQAHPWYAAPGQVARPSNSANPPTVDDPSIDAVYPVTWFPGTSDENAAITIPLRDGESRQADVHLTPIPSIHLMLPLPTQISTPGQGNRPPFAVPNVQPIGSSLYNNFQIHTNISNGQVDIGGLAPGIYRVNMPNPNGGPGSSSTIQISPNSSRSLDLASASANSATVTIQADGASGAESARLVFVDASNPRNLYREDRGGFGRDGGFGPGPGNFGPPPDVNVDPRPTPLSQITPALQPVSSQVGGDIGAQPPNNPRQPNGGQQRFQRDQRERPPRTIELPPGDYLVYSEGTNLFLTGFTLGTRDIPGRLVSIPDGASTLTAHFVSGRATISGIATVATKPSVGAMVVLVPITLGQPGAITEIRRDQTNTDGSFDLPNVIPGQYILIAIDRGWNVNWHDPATLANYLVHGVPLDLSATTKLTQNIEAQLP